MGQLRQGLIRLYPHLYRKCMSKIRFATKEEAAGFQTRNGHKLYPYHCDVCHTWHLTKMLHGEVEEGK